MDAIRDTFLKHVALTNDEPFMFVPVAGNGSFLVDESGKSFLDLIAGVCVSAIGHGNPEVRRAIEEQLNRYMHTMVYGEHVQFAQVRLAELITSLLPESLNNVYFTNSGTEATEGAMKLAKRVTGRHKFVSASLSYHGSTQGSLSLNSLGYFTRAFRPLLPEVSHIRYNNLDDLEIIDEETAGVVIESVQGGAGYIPSTPEFMEALRNRCNEVGCMLILDEIQAGFGRTGAFWSFEDYDIVPDILLLGKALGGGLPLGAFVASKSHMERLRKNPALGHITSFGGNPVSCAASIATIEYILDHNLTRSIPEKSSLFREQLIHPDIVNISGKGLMLAVELESFEKVLGLTKYGLSHGFLTNWFLFNDKCIRISPPLNISDDEIRLGCEMILAGLERL